jgi:hypothetical protein
MNSLHSTPAGIAAANDEAAELVAFAHYLSAHNRITLDEGISKATAIADRTGVRAEFEAALIAEAASIYTIPVEPNWRG